MWRDFFIYISKSRSYSINDLNDIASINKAAKLVNGCLEAKYFNISTICNDDVQYLPLLLFILEAVNSRTTVKPQQLL